MYLNGLTLARRKARKEVRAQPEQYYTVFCSSRNLSGFLTQTLDPWGMLLVPLPSADKVFPVTAAVEAKS